MKQTIGMKCATDEEDDVSENKRGAYEKTLPDSRARIARYTAENGIAAAIRHFKKNSFLPSLKESTVRGWKNA